MTDPLVTIQRLIDDKRVVYCSSGLSSSVNGRIFFTMWGCPSDKILATGYGDTVEDAARDAIRKVPGQPLPGLTARPALPGMTR